jgi:hypothetical protein
LAPCRRPRFPSFFRRGFAPLGCKPLDDASSGL